MSEAPRRRFPPTTLGAPVPGEEGRPVVQDPLRPPPRLDALHVLTEAGSIVFRHHLPILFLTAVLYGPFLLLALLDTPPLR